MRVWEAGGRPQMVVKMSANRWGRQAEGKCHGGKGAWEDIKKQHKPLGKCCCFLNISSTVNRTKTRMLGCIWVLKPLVSSLHSTLLPSHSMRYHSEITARTSMAGRDFHLPTEPGCAAFAFCSREVMGLSMGPRDSQRRPALWALVSSPPSATSYVSIQWVSSLPYRVRNST